MDKGMRSLLAALCLHVVASSVTCDPTGDVVRKLLDRVDQLEVREKAREAEVDNLRGTISDLHERLADMDALRHTVHDLNKRLAEFETLRNDKGAFKDTLDESGSRKVFSELSLNESTHVPVSSEKAEGRGLPYNGRIDTPAYNTHKQRIRRQSETGSVAFYAVVDTHHLQNLGAHQRLVFDRAITNIGNAYHAHLGLFLCPTDGIYVFTTTLMGVNHDNSHYYISLNGQAVANVLIHGEDSYLATSGRTIVLYLHKGDEVSVNNMNVTEGVFGYQFSSFSGFLLNQEVLDNDIVG